jgi:hypothetical protein
MEAICHIMGREGKKWKVYVDDFIGLFPELKGAQDAFEEGKNTLSDLGVDRSVDKDMGPTTEIKWIGVIFNTINMTVTIPQEKIKEALQMIRDWLRKKTATRHMLQVLLGRLFHVSKCCTCARLFVNRMLSTLREAPGKGTCSLSPDFRKDLRWFAVFLPMYNGIYLIKPSVKIHDIHIDYSDNICGAYFGDSSFHVCRPNFTDKYVHNEVHRELLSIHLAYKLWGHEWQDESARFHVRNKETLELMNSGKSKDLVAVSIACNIWVSSVMYNCQTAAISLVDRPVRLIYRLESIETHWFKLCSDL